MQPTLQKLATEKFKLEGRLTFQGLPIAVENRKGSVRSGVDKDGTPWRTVMKFPYGYLKGTKGVDGEEVDCYVGPDKDATHAYVVHQRKEDGRAFDEDKVMLGFPSEEAARKAYLAHYDDPKFLGPISSIPMERLKEAIKNKEPVVKVAERYKLEGDALIRVGPDGKSLGKPPIKLAASSCGKKPGLAKESDALPEGVTFGPGDFRPVDINRKTAALSPAVSRTLTGTGIGGGVGLLGGGLIGAATSPEEERGSGALRGALVGGLGGGLLGTGAGFGRHLYLERLARKSREAGEAIARGLQQRQLPPAPIQEVEGVPVDHRPGRMPTPSKIPDAEYAPINPYAAAEAEKKRQRTAYDPVVDDPYWMRDQHARIAEQARRAAGDIEDALRGRGRKKVGPAVRLPDGSYKIGHLLSTKEAASLTPSLGQHLGKTTVGLSSARAKLVGAPRVTMPAGPSLAQQARTFGTPLPGAIK